MTKKLKIRYNKGCGKNSNLLDCPEIHDTMMEGDKRLMDIDKKLASLRDQIKRLQVQKKEIQLSIAKLRQ